MIRFDCDYVEGAHPRIVEYLVETNMEQTIGYGEDEHCIHARKKIQKVFACEHADVHFLVGGTQTNLTAIAAVLKPYQGVIAASTGHINVHETGAIEACGHKVLAIPSEDGKITAEQVQEMYDAHWSDESHEHIVQPGMVYISFPTENGTLYSKKELEALSAVCKKCSLPLYIDGARLGYGLTSKANDIAAQEFVKYSDMFYIGGTKVGALMGEALVIVNDAFKKDFRYLIKQKGGMLAKGRLLGIQFEALFEDDLYFEIARHANHLAEKIKAGFLEKGYQMLFDSPTNQQYPIISDEKLKELSEKYAYCYWCRVDENHSAVRICTSWATKEENVAKLLEDI